MFAFRLLAPVCVSVLLLSSGCGGGSSPAAPGGPTAPGEPGNPGTPGASVTMSARSGSPQHTAVSWLGGTSGSTWRLERRREGGGSGAAYALVAEVEAASGLWLDSGLAADTAYAYRLSRSDGSVVAAASARTGTEAVLATAAPQPAGETVSWPVTRTTARVGLDDKSVALELPPGSLTQDGTVTLQPITNPVPEGIGLGMSLDLPERPAATLTLELGYDADEDPEDVLQDRIAMRQRDGSWWLLPLAAHDRTQRVLRVRVPPNLWVEPPMAAAQAVRPAGAATTSAAASAAGGVRGYFVRVKAHKLVPPAASVRVLGSQHFVPVSIYTIAPGNEACDDADTNADGQLCVPMPILRDVTVPILNSKPGYQRQWTLLGSPAPDPAFGSLAVQSPSGVVYTAPGLVPATNPVQLRFESTNTRTGQRLVLTANVRITEDAWVGRMDAFIGDLGQGHLFRLEIRWSLDMARSTATRRVYIPAGTAEHLYTIIDPVCTHTVAPTRLSLAQAQPLGQLVVDESTSPPRYALDLTTRWNALITVSCPPGSTTAPFPGGHIWSSQGVVSGGRIEGSDRDLGDRSWSLGRSE